MVSVSPKNGKIEAGRRLETRSVFISHSHADRGLAKGLIELVEAVFSGVVVPFASSDPAPTGGLMPGDEWFAQIHARLREAEAVWVIATPHSVTRPWIYWESGIGRAICPGGLVVLRVRLTKGEVPSPLSALQSYDGLSEGDEGIKVMLGKVATQIGMKLAPVLVDKYVPDWIALAGEHKPEMEGSGPAPSVSPEQLDRVEGAIARLEALSAAPASGPPGARARRQALRSAADPWSTIYTNIDRLTEVLNAEPAETTFEFAGIDDEGDAAIHVIREGEIGFGWLHSEALPHLKRRTDVPARTAKLIDDIISAYQAQADRPAPSRRPREQAPT